MRHKLVSILFFFFTAYHLNGQVADISFRQVSPPGGFTLKSINSITQDRLGYIWMGTNQGLIRYDSKNTNWFIPSANDSLGLPDEAINCVQTDSKNNVWICTNNGLCQFNRLQQKFTPINYPVNFTYENGNNASLRISSIIEDNNKLLVLDANYIGYLDLTNKKLNRIGINKIQNPSHIYKDNNNRIWIGTNNGEVFLLNRQRNKVEKILDAKGSPVNSIYADNNELWIGYNAHGAQLYTVKGKFIKHYTFAETPNRKTKNLRIRKILKDTYGRLWIGAYEGLFMHDGEKMTRFNKEKNPGLPHTSIYEIYEDKQGGLWIGTWSGGVALIHHSDNNFKTYRHHQFGNSISNNIVSSFSQTSKNELLIGTEVGGLNKFNLISKDFSKVHISNSIKVENIKSMCKDKFGRIWIGTYRQGLWYQPTGENNFKHFINGPEDGQHLSHNSVYSLCPTDSGIWIGTYGLGVNFYSFNTQSISFPFHTNRSTINMVNLHINCVFTDSHSNLWIGGEQGLIKVHLTTGEIDNFSQNHFKGKNNLIVYVFWEDSSGNIWIGVKNEAVLIYKPKSDSIEKFDANGLLTGKDVYGFIEDENKNIWISTNSGLFMYNPNKNSYRHLVYNDGIQSNLFNPKAIFKARNGNLYFGGTNGFTCIEPTKIKLNTKKPLTTIHQLVSKNNKAVYPNYSKERNIENIQLKPTENTFRINFSADNYLMPEKNKYKYRLINYYDDWIENGNEGSVLFTSLNAGEYIFEVKACNNDGVWNEEPTRLTITIQKYWYKTNAAFIAYFVFFALILFFISRFYSERLKLKRAVLLEKTQRENEEQIHEMKLKFFTNISHEFRTPLTLISWPLKRLLSAENITLEQREELEVVHRNSNRLLQLINQLIDLRKLEKGKSKLNLSRFDLIEFINEMHQGFSSEDKSKEMDFEIESEFGSFEIDADREKLDIILYNLLSNAYKYSPKRGKIRIKVSNKNIENSRDYTNQLSFGKLECDDFVEIALEDSGSGIESEDLLNIFNRFEQGKKQKNGHDKVKGSGIGLSICKDYTLLHHGTIKAQSNAGSGSCFTIQIPRKQKAQAILFESHQEIKNLKSTDPAQVKSPNNHLPGNRSQLLVVEDNTDFRKFIIEFLSRYYQVEFAVNGEEALRILKKRNIDLVVSDVMMPEMDGFEFCSIVKTQVETSHIPVILLTALSTSENLIAGLDKGADAYLTKPFDENILLKQIENILEQRRRIRKTFKQQFVSQTTVEVGSLDNFFLNRVRAVVEKNISDENFSMESLAEELMISRSQLHRKIKSLSGTTTSEFVNLVRIKKAVELIENNNYLFNEVAYQVGFSNQSYFTKCFKKVYGVSPKEYFNK